ncbi:MAG: hypothetical protein KatS3mg009_1971 [Acidimicrobiia bacterium]|nr:MAG: hypothetical protein KatS3mg009_1971 [Acidimicrobiia bacterium]
MTDGIPTTTRPARDGGGDPARRRRARHLFALVAAGVLALGACNGDDGTDEDAGGAGGATTATQPAAAAAPLVFNGQGNDLVAYATEPPFEDQVVIPHYDEARQPDGLDINAQICFDPDDPRRFVAGEDTLQSTTGEPGWGIFELEGDRIGELSARQVGKLVPTYQPTADNPENYGCGFLADGRIVTTDIGDQVSGANGQLIVWFPPFESRDVGYCKLDVTLPTAQSILVDGDSVYVAAARGGVFRYDATTFPTSPAPEDGCDGEDGTGAPLATGVTREQFLSADDTNGIATPAGLALGPDGQLYVSSVFNGVISEFTRDGTFVRRVLEPPAGETLGERPFTTGTPLGIGVGPDGTLYYADIGIVVSEGGVGPGERTGTVRRIRFADGEPQPPETMADGLAFPDGIGVWVP